MSRCGFVAVIGAPNAGKSTMVNQLVGAKVSIISHKVQTTRNRIMGIFIDDDSQVVMLDTPGIFFNAKTRLERSMVHAAWSALEEANKVICILDASKPKNEDAKQIIQKVIKDGVKPIVVLNKVDLVSKEKLLPLASEFDPESIDKLFMISATNGSGIEELRSYLSNSMPDSPWMFDEDQISDIPMRMLMAEITREQVYKWLHKELPYSIHVETEAWEDFDNGDVKISQVIYVEKETQRAIVLGKGGKQIKLLGEKAREEMTKLMERRVHLMLRVKVKQDWSNDPSIYDTWGLTYNT